MEPKVEEVIEAGALVSNGLSGVKTAMDLAQLLDDVGAPLAIDRGAFRKTCDRIEIPQPPLKPSVLALPNIALAGATSCQTVSHVLVLSQ
jgi:hypothetical protein